MSSTQPLTPLERRLLAAVERMEEEAMTREAALHETVAELRAEVMQARTEVATCVRLVTDLSACLGWLMSTGEPASSTTAGPTGSETPTPRLP